MFNIPFHRVRSISSFIPKSISKEKITDSVNNFKSTCQCHICSIKISYIPFALFTCSLFLRLDGSPPPPLRSTLPVRPIPPRRSTPQRRPPAPALAAHERQMDTVAPRLSRSSTRYGPVSSSAASFSGPVRKWRKAWVPLAGAGAAGSGVGASRGENKVVLFRWTPVNGGSKGGGGAASGMEPAAAGRRRYVPVSLLGFRHWVNLGWYA